MILPEELFFRPERPKTYAARQGFLLGCPQIVNLVHDHLVTPERYDEVRADVVAAILDCFTPYFAPAFQPLEPRGVDDRTSPLFFRTLQLVRRAQEIDLNIRRADSVAWTFLGTPGQTLWTDEFGYDAIKAHDAGVSIPRQNRGGTSRWSRISLNVVPGLVRFDLVRESDGASSLQKVICRPAKAFADLQRRDMFSPYPVAPQNSKG